MTAAVLNVVERDVRIGWGISVESARALVFGRMVKLTHETQRSYFSDLYHDALWISEHLTGSLTFYFAVEENGTAISTDRDRIRPRHGRQYEIRVTTDASEQDWRISIDELVA